MWFFTAFSHPLLHLKVYGPDFKGSSASQGWSRIGFLPPRLWLGLLLATVPICGIHAVYNDWGLWTSSSQLKKKKKVYSLVSLMWHEHLKKGCCKEAAKSLCLPDSRELAECEVCHTEVCHTVCSTEAGLEEFRASCSFRFFSLSLYLQFPSSRYTEGISKWWSYDLLLGEKWTEGEMEHLTSSGLLNAKTLSRDMCPELSILWVKTVSLSGIAAGFWKNKGNPKVKLSQTLDLKNLPESQLYTPNSTSSWRSLSDNHPMKGWCCRVQGKCLRPFIQNFWTLALEISLGSPGCALQS